MKTHNDQRLIDQFLTNHQQMAVAAIETLEIDEVALLIENMAPDKSRIVLTNLAPHKAGKVLERVSFEQAVNIVRPLPTNILESILRVTNSSFRKQVLAELPPDVRKLLRRSLTYRKNQVGAHLEARVLTLSEKSSVEKSLSEIKTTQATVQPLLFVLSPTQELVGYVEISDLLLNSPQKTVHSIMKPVPPAVVADMSVKDVLQNWNDSFAYLPVVKGEGQFIGVASRSTLSKLDLTKVDTDKLVVKAGSALGDLYLIGLTGLLGSSDQRMNP